MLSAEDLHARAVKAAGGGRFRHAKRLFQTALTRATDPSLVAALNRGLGYTEAELGDAAGGLRLLTRTLSDARVLPASERGMLFSQRGLIRIRQGDVKGALADYASAEPLLAGEPEELARIGINRGNIFLDQGQIEAAIDDFTMALEQFRLLRRTVGEAKAMGNLGYAHMLAGDLVQALRLMNDSYAVLERESPALLPVSDQDRAEALLAAGLREESIELLRRAATQFGVRRQRLRQAGAEMTLAQLLAWDEPRAAARLAGRAARRFERAGAPRQALRCRALRTACQLSLGTADPVEAERLLAELRRLGMRRDALSLQVLLTGYSRKASTLRLPPGAPLTLRLLAADLRATEAEDAGRGSRALRLVRDALDELAAWQSTFGSLDLQTSVTGHAQPLLERGLRLAVASGRTSTVYEWIERTGAVTGRLNPLRPPADASIAHDLTRLRALSLDTNPTPELQHERLTLLRQVRERSWLDQGGARLRELVPLPRLREELAACEATMVAPFGVGDATWALVVSDGTAGLVQLGRAAAVREQLAGLPADLDLAAADLPPQLVEPVIASLLDRMQRLDDLIFAPVRPLLNTRRVLINPMGLFSGLPWTLMPSLQGRSVTVPRSASAWVTSREKPHEFAKAGFAAGPRLPRSAVEVAEAATHWTAAEVLAGTDATATAVSDLAGRVDLLHLAAHGHHVADNPLFSNLELADGPWFGYDLDQLPQVPETVILSACELGATTIRRGDELLGLTTAWLHAGARCVIASPASVSDEVAAAILPAMHAELARGLPPADALAAAMAAHPDQLSTFQCYGAGW